MTDSREEEQKAPEGSNPVSRLLVHALNLLTAFNTGQPITPIRLEASTDKKKNK